MFKYLDFEDSEGDVLKVEENVSGDTLLFVSTPLYNRAVWAMVNISREQVSELIDHLIKFRDYVKPIEIGDTVEWCGNPGVEFTVLSVIEEWAWIQYPHGNPCTMPLHQLKNVKQED